MSDAATEAQQYVDTVGVQHRADLIAAFYLRLKGHKIPPRLCADWTLWEFWPNGGYEQDD